MERDISIFTWNARRIKRQLGMLNFLNTYDLILNQETWLHNFEANLLEKVLSHHTIACKSSMPGDIISRGSPYGGLAIA